MSEKIYFITVIMIIFITLSNIYVNKNKRRKRQNSEIIKLSRSSSSFIFGMVFFTIGVIWFIMLLNSLIKSYSLIGDDFGRSIFQLFNFKYIDNLIQYYYEKNIVKHIFLSNHKNQLYKSLLWIAFSFCSSINYFYLWYHKNIIYESGILINGMLIPWQKISDYRWGDAYGKRFFDKGNYYDLSIITKSESINLIVSYDDKNMVNEILKKYIM